MFLVRRDDSFEFTEEVVNLFSFDVIIDASLDDGEDGTGSGHDGKRERGERGIKEKETAMLCRSGLYAMEW